MIIPTLSNSPSPPRLQVTALDEEEFYLTVLKAPESSNLEPGHTVVARTDDNAAHILGRSSLADIPLEDVSISRKHARIEWDGQCWRLHNISKRNGVFLEGEAIEPGTARAFDDSSAVRIQLGKVLLRLEWVRATQPHTDPIALDPPEATSLPETKETLLRIVRDGDCCVVYCKGRRVNVKPSSALALYALGQRPGEIVHHWDIMDLIARDLDLPQAISGARRSIRELLDRGEISREEVISSILATNADAQRKQLEELDDAALSRHLIFSRRGHGYGLALPAERVDCDEE